MSAREPVRRRLNKTIDREQFPPAYLRLIASAHEWGGSRIYTDHFGVTSPDFAILSTLSNNPGCQAVDITEIVALDKSVVSRRLKRLSEKGLVCWEQDGTRRRIYLTEEGARVHDQVLPVALARSERLMAGFSDAEKTVLHEFLQRMFSNLPAVNDPHELPLP